MFIFGESTVLLGGVLGGGVLLGGVLLGGVLGGGVLLGGVLLGGVLLGGVVVVVSPFPFFQPTALKRGRSECGALWMNVIV